MATRIEKWKANDGSEWPTEERARERDAISGLIAGVMLLLPKRPELPGCGFENGAGYIQHDPDNLRSVRMALYEIAASGPLKWWVDSQKAEHGKTDDQLAYDVHPSWFGRMLDGGCDPLGRAYTRLCCIDAQHREWGQPYYASHPEQAKDVRLVA